MKKKIKNKYLPKASFSSSLFGGSSSFGQGMEGEGESGMGAAGAMGIVGDISGMVKNFIPQDNDRYGITRKGQKISSGIEAGLDTAAAMDPEPISKGILMLGSLLTKGITAVVDKVKENRNPKDKRWDKQFNPINPNASTLNFGTIPTGKYGMSLYSNGGKVEPIYTDNPKDKRLKAYNDSLSLYKKYPNNKYAIESTFDNLNSVNNNVQSGIDSKTLYPNLDFANNNKIKPTKVEWAQTGGGNYTEEELKKGNWVHYNVNGSGANGVTRYFTYKKPVQPVILQKEIPKPKIDFFKNLPKEILDSILGDKVQYQEDPTNSLSQTVPLKGNYNFQPRPNGGYNVYTLNGKRMGYSPDQNSNNIRQDEFALGGPLQQKNYMNDFNTELYKSMSNVQERQQLLAQPWINPQAMVPQSLENMPNINYNINTKKIKYGKNNNFELFNNVQFAPQFDLGGDPRSQAHIEAEQGEAMLGQDNKIESIEGQKHEQGGTPLALKGDEQYIFSDRLGFNKQGLPTINEKEVTKSFADKAKSIEKKYASKKDRIAEKSKELELNQLTQFAEQARVAKEQEDMGKQMKKYQAKYGKALKQFANSGYTTFPQRYNDEEVDPNSILAMQQKLLQYNPNALPKYGADNLYGDETKKAFEKNPGVYNFIKEQTNNTSTQNITPIITGGVSSSNFIGPKMYAPRDMNRYDSQVYQPGLVKRSTPIERTSASAQDNQEDIGPVKNERNGLFKNLTTGDKLGLAGMIPGTLYNFAMGLKKPQKEGFYTNPYQNEVLGLMQNRKFDAQQFINEAEMANTEANQNISDNASSVGVKLANMSKAHANYLNSLSGITGKAQEMNNNYRAEEAQVKNNMGEILRQEGIRQSGINAQNQAAKQGFMAKAMTQLGQGISAVGQASNQSLTNTILAKSLSEISPDFDVNKLKDLYDRGKVDKDGYFTFNGTKYQYIPNENRVVAVTSTTSLPALPKSPFAPK